jgi:hypothetical protein
VAWQGMDPRLEGHMIALTGGLNRWFLRHPFRGPVICFIIGWIVLGLSFIPGMGRLIYLTIPPFLIGLLLLAYALIRRATGITFVEDEDVEEELPPETPVDVDKQTRQQAVERWRRWEREDRHRQ